MINTNARRGALTATFLFVCGSVLGAGAALAGGEAGPINLRDQGFFWTGTRLKEVTSKGLDGKTSTGTAIYGPMYVGFELVQKKQHPYPLVLIHGGGGQATDWMGTPDGRDGWLDYFLAAGFDVYFVDRPAHGRSPGSRFYGEEGDPVTTQQIANAFTLRSKQYPGGGGADTKELAQHTASSEPGPTAPNKILQEDLAELLDRIGPAILVTHSAGGVSGWLATAARPKLVKAVLAIEPAMGVLENLAPLITFQPALAPGQKIDTVEVPAKKAGENACQLQSPGNVRTVPAYSGKQILFVESPFSPFTGNVHCSVDTLNQLGAKAKLARLVDYGIHGNGHFMNEELNNGEIARKVFIPWLSSIK